MRVSQGGTQIFCPHCEEVRVCEAIPTTKLGEPAGQRWHKKGHEDIQWFRRGRKCQWCGQTFITAEVDEGFLHELVKLRTALAEIKSDAEGYIEQSVKASEALSKLTDALDVLRTLKMYNDA